MLSRFFQKDTTKQQQNGLGDVDALDQAMTDPRQQTVSPIVNHQTKNQSDDDESVSKLSFMDNNDDSGDEGTVDTTNSKLLMDMVKNSFLLGLVHEVNPDETSSPTGSAADDNIDPNEEESKYTTIVDPNEPTGGYTSQDDDYDDDDDDDDGDDRSLAFDDSQEVDDSQEIYDEAEDDYISNDDEDPSDESGSYGIDEDDDNPKPIRSQIEQRRDGSENNSSGSESSVNNDRNKLPDQRRGPLLSARVSAVPDQENQDQLSSSHHSSSDKESDPTAQQPMEPQNRFGWALRRPLVKPPQPNESNDENDNNNTAERRPSASQHSESEKEEKEDEPTLIQLPPQIRFGWASRRASIKVSEPVAEPTPSTRRRMWGWSAGTSQPRHSSGSGGAETASERSENADVKDDESSNPPPPNDAERDSSSNHNIGQGNEPTSASERDISHSKNDDGHPVSVSEVTTRGGANELSSKGSNQHPTNTDIDSKDSLTSSTKSGNPPPTSTVVDDVHRTTDHQSLPVDSDGNDVTALGSLLGSSAHTHGDNFLKTETTNKETLSNQMKNTTSTSDMNSQESDHPHQNIVGGSNTINLPTSAPLISDPVSQTVSSLNQTNEIPCGSMKSATTARSLTVNSDAMDGVSMKARNDTPSSVDRPAIDPAPVTTSNETIVAGADDRRSQLKKQKSWLDAIIGGDEESDNKDAIPEPITIITQASKGWLDSILGNQPNGTDNDRSLIETRIASSDDKTETTTNRRPEYTRSKSWLESVFVGESPENPLVGGIESTPAQTDREKHEIRQEVKPKGWFESVLAGEGNGQGSHGTDDKEINFEKGQSTEQSRKPPIPSKSWLDTVFVGKEEKEHDIETLQDGNDKDRSTSVAGRICDSAATSKSSISEENEPIHNIKIPNVEKERSCTPSTNKLSDANGAQMKNSLEPVLGDKEKSGNKFDEASNPPIDRRSDLKRSKSWLESVFVGEDNNPDDEANSHPKEQQAENTPNQTDLKRSKSWLESVLTGDEQQDKMQTKVEISLVDPPPPKLSNGKSENDNSFSARPVRSENDGSIKTEIKETLPNDRRADLKRSKSWLESLLDHGEDTNTPTDEQTNKLSSKYSTQPDQSVNVSVEPKAKLSPEKSNGEHCTVENADRQYSKTNIQDASESMDSKRSQLVRSASWLSLVLGNEDEDESTTPDYVKKPEETLLVQRREETSIDKTNPSNEKSQSQSKQQLNKQGEVEAEIKNPSSCSEGQQSPLKNADLNRSKSWLESVLSGDEEAEKAPTTKELRDPRRNQLTRSTSWLSLVLGDDEEPAAPDYLGGKNETQFNDDPNTSTPIVTEKLPEMKPFRFEKSKGPKPSSFRGDKMEEKLEGSNTGVSPPARPKPGQITRSKSWLNVMLGDEENQPSGEDEPRAEAAKNLTQDIKQTEVNRSKSWLESIVGEEVQTTENKTADQQSWLVSVFGHDEVKKGKNESSPVRGVARSATLQLSGDLHNRLKTVEHLQDENDNAMEKMFKEDEPVVIALPRSSREPIVIGNDENQPVNRLLLSGSSSHHSADSGKRSISDNKHTTRDNEKKLSNKSSNIDSKHDSRKESKRAESFFAKRALFRAVSSLSYKTGATSTSANKLSYVSKHIDLKALSITKAIFGEGVTEQVPIHKELLNDGMSVTDDDIPDYLRVGPELKANEASEQVFDVAAEEEAEPSKSSEDDSSASEISGDNGKATALGKIAVNLAPMLRLQNVTQATRSQLPEASKSEKATSRWKALFRRNDPILLRPKEPPKDEEDIIESEPSVDGKDESSEVESEDSLSNGVVDAEREIKEVMHSVQEESQTETDEDNCEIESKRIHGVKEGIVLSVHPRPTHNIDFTGTDEVVDETQCEKKCKQNPETIDEVTELTKTATTLLQTLTPEDIEKIAGKISALPSRNDTATHEKPTNQSMSPSKRKKKKSISSLLEMNNARKVGRHGDEVSVGTMNITKKTNQNGRMVVVAKALGAAFDDQINHGPVKRRPWELAMQKGPKKQLHELDKENEDELQKVEILAKSEEFFGCGPASLHNHLPVLAETVEESDEDESEETIDDETLDDETLAKQKVETNEIDDEENFTEIWDNVSCDESVALEFMRSQQKKNHEREKKRQKKELMKAEWANATKRLRLFEKSKDIRGSTQRGSKKSKLSEEFIDAIHRVFEKDSDSSLWSGSDESCSENSLGSGLSGSCKSIYLDDSADSPRADEASLASHSKNSDTNMSDEHSAYHVDNDEDDFAPRKTVPKRKKRKRSSKRETDASDLFLKEIERLQAPKILTIQSLRQEMIDRRGTSVNLLKKEYVTFKKKRSDKKSGQDEVQPIDFGALTAQRRRSSTGKSNNEEDAADKISQPGVGLAEKLSRWAIAEGVTELDDLATVTTSPTKTINMFGVGVHNANTVAKPLGAVTVPAVKDPNPITPRGPTGSARPTSRSATGTARRSVSRGRPDDLGAFSAATAPLDRPGNVTESGGTAQLFAASFDVPLNSIQEGSDNEDDFGLLTNLRNNDGSDDERSFSNTSAKKSSNKRFSLGAKVGQKMKKLVPKLPSMKGGSHGRNGSGFMLSDNEW